MQVFESPGASPIKAWVDGVEFDTNAREQVENIARMPFIFKHIAVMPDVHLGIGATIGSVIATQGAIIPASVGVDIGCGMMAVKTNITADQLPDDLSGLRREIERRVPHGRTDNGGRGDRGAWHEVPVNVQRSLEAMYGGLQNIYEIAPNALPKDESSIARQLGTMGGGNHFCEVCLDTEGSVWVMLHSGSRGVGNRIGTYFIEQAKEVARDWMFDRWLPDKDLAYLPESSPLFKDYCSAVLWAQEYAFRNRQLMMEAALDALGSVLPGLTVEVIEDAVNCHHNYVSHENHFGKNVWVTRKGAVRARKGDMGIIPGSMGAKSFIVRGKGNPESFESCSHGAGRRMGRNEAKRQRTVADLVTETQGVECRKDADVLDEIPSAYKSIDAVMAAQADLVDIVATLRQVVCVKG